MEPKKLILNICKERGCISSIPYYCLNHSNGRTKELNELSPFEISKLLETLQYFNEDNILIGIYTIAKDLKIIPEFSKENEVLIIEFLKRKKIIDFTTNEIKIPGNDPESIIIAEPLKSLSFTGKILVATILGDIYLKHLQKGS